MISFVAIDFPITLEIKISTLCTASKQVSFAASLKIYDKRRNDGKDTISK